MFNDILGFRAFCDDYNQILEKESLQFRIADMSSGKAIDDGYRGVHVYYQKSGKHYPIADEQASSKLNHLTIRKRLYSIRLCQQRITL